MDNSPSSNTSERTRRRHTIDANDQTIMPRYDFVLPSYSRDRRISSIIATIPSATIMNDGTTNINLATASEANSTSAEGARNEQGKRLHALCLSPESFDLLLDQENRYSLEQMVSYRHGRHVADKALPRHVR